MKIRQLLVTLAASSMLLGLSAQTPADTLRRSMTLQRAYIPETGQAKKEFFNPLAGQTPRQLHPLDFARNNYSLSMKARPRLFTPSENLLLPDYGSHHFYARLFGGYPVKAGGNIGAHFRAGEYGTITLALDHTSRHVTGEKGRLDEAPINETHDTEGLVRYSQKLPDSNRMLEIEGFGFGHAHSLYGHPLSSVKSGELPYLVSTATPEKPELMSYYGTGLSVSLSPAPLSALSTWEYSLSATVDYGNRNADVNAAREGEPIGVYIDGRGDALHAGVQGSLTYGAKINDFRFGVDAGYEINRFSLDKEVAGGKASQIITFIPHFDYIIPSLQVRAGVKVQLPTMGAKQLLITPDALLRWRMHDKASMLLSATGGMSMLSMRDLYRINRYADPMSIAQGIESSTYDVALGLELGSWYGFALDLKGGFADYRDFYDFASKSGSTPTPEGYQGEPYAEVAVFDLRNLGSVRHGYFSLGARYMGAEGLSGSLGVKYNHYARPALAEEESVRVDHELMESVLGRPALELTADLAYSPIKDLTLSANFLGLGGIKMQQLLPRELVREREEVVYTLPFTTKLDAQVSYKVLKNLGVSLTVENLLNQRMQRWCHYYSPGIGVYGSITLEL